MSKRLFFKIILLILIANYSYGQDSRDLIASDEQRRFFNEASSQDTDPSGSQRPFVFEKPMIDVLEVKSKDIVEVLDLIEEKSGLTILVDDTAIGDVTIYLRDVDARDAIRIILDMVNLAYRENNGLIKVMTKTEYQTLYGRPFDEDVKSRAIPLKNVGFDDVKMTLYKIIGPEGKILHDSAANTVIVIDRPDVIQVVETLLREIDVPLETEIFALNYAPAEEVAEKIEEALTDQVGRVQFDKKSNKITVTDTHLKIKEMRERIVQLDEEDKQVAWRVRILQITLNDEYEQGVDWEAIVSDFKAVPFEGFTNSTEEYQTTMLSMGTVSDEDYSVLLEALDTVGIINQLSEETVYVDGTKTEISVKTRDLDLGVKDDEKNENNIIHEDFRLMLTLKEQADAYEVTMAPQLYIAQDEFGVKKTLKHALKSGEAELKIKKRDTIVIGGLFKEVTVESIKKIPFLAEIPFLGFAFRLQGEQMRNTEVIIFLTAETIKKRQEGAVNE